MDNDKDTKAIVEKEVEIIDEWLDKMGWLNQLVPHVQRIRNQTMWQSEVFKTMPRELTEGIGSSHFERQEQFYTYLKNNLPQLPNTESTVASSLSAISSSVTSTTYALIFNRDFSMDSCSQEWSKKEAQKYIQMQERQAVASFLVDKLESLKPNLGNEYRQAMDACSHAIGLNADFHGPAVRIRNVLEQTKGQLFECARKVKNTKNMKWREVIERICKAGNDSTEYKMLCEEVEKYTGIHGDLTLIAKNQKSTSRNEFQGLIVKTNANLYSLLGLIDEVCFC